MSLTPLTPPLPPRKVRLCHIFFALLMAMNDPLPAKLNCAENIDLKYLLLFIDLQLEGYIHAQSPVKTVRNSRTPYFDCLFQTDKDKRSVLSVLILPKESTCNRHINKSHV